MNEPAACNPAIHSATNPHTIDALENDSHASLHHSQPSSAFADESAQVFEQLFDSLRCGLLLLDAEGCVNYLNQIAREMLRSNNCIRLHANRLQFMDARTQHHFNTRLTAACTTSACVSLEESFALRVARKDGAADYLGICAPLWPRNTRTVAGVTRALWLFDVESDHCVSLPLLMQLHGLTHAEARISRSLFRGLSIDEVSRELRISRHTVKTHLKHIFRKCAVSSQVGLLRLLAMGSLHP